MFSNLYGHIPTVPADPILGLAALIKKDPRENKIDLTIGIYRDQDGASNPMEVVKEAEKKIIGEAHTKVYLPIEGDLNYLDKTGEILFGTRLYPQLKSKIVKAQAVGGTSALFTLASFYSAHISKRIWISNPTWPNHYGIFKKTGFEILDYPYYDPISNKKSIDEMLKILENAQEKDLLLLHGCCHNPSGQDPKQEEWVEILKLAQRKKIIPIFDVAYQGFGDSLDEDAYSIRLFLEAGIPLAVAVSHSKNFGLYAERVGASFIVTDLEESASRVLGNIKSLIRTDYSNPPKHGALIVSTILSDSKLKRKWEEELAAFQMRINTTKRAFLKELEQVGLGHEFYHLYAGKGMFCFTGLSEQQVKKLKEEHAIYMTSNGRINITGLNDKNMKTVAEAILSVKNEYA